MSMERNYKAMMDQANPPASLQDEVLARAAALRETEDVRSGHSRRRVQQTSQHQSKAEKRHGHSVIALIAGGAIAAALIAGIVIVIPSLPYPSPNDTSALNPTPNGQKNVFGLAIYANADEVGKSVDIATGESGITLSTSAGSLSDASELLCQVNLNCVGENIETLTYRIEGADTYFEETELQAPDDGATRPISRSTLLQEMFIEYDQQHPENYLFRIKIDLSPSEVRALDDLDLSNEEAMLAAKTERFIEASCKAAEKIDQAVLSVTASFTDGSTATKRYRISPIDNYKQVLADRMDASGPNQREDDPRLTAPLFTITEIE